MSDLIDVVASFIPPTDANFRGVHGYLEAPDFSFAAAFQVNVTAVGSGVVQGIRIDLGIASSTLPNAAGVITVVWKTNLPYPSVGMPTQTYRLYFQSVGPNYDPPIVASNQPNATPSLTFLVAPATAFGAGEEFAPRVTDPLVTLETRFEQSTYSYRPTVVWKDPIAADYAARISSF